MSPQDGISDYEGIPTRTPSDFLGNPLTPGKRLCTVSAPLVSSPCPVMRFFSLAFLGSHTDGALFELQDLRQHMALDTLPTWIQFGECMGGLWD